MLGWLGGWEHETEDQARSGGDRGRWAGGCAGAWLGGWMGGPGAAVVCKGGEPWLAGRWLGGWAGRGMCRAGWPLVPLACELQRKAAAGLSWQSTPPCGWPGWMGRMCLLGVELTRSRCCSMSTTWQPGGALVAAAAQLLLLFLWGACWVCRWALLSTARGGAGLPTLAQLCGGAALPRPGWARRLDGGTPGLAGVSARVEVEDR